MDTIKASGVVQTQLCNIVATNRCNNKGYYDKRDDRSQGW